MKSKLPPLALGGAMALCALVVGLAIWTFSTPSVPAGVDEHGGGPELAPAAPRAGGPTSAPAAEVVPAGAGEASRVALEDESKAPALPQVEFELRSSSDGPLSSARVVIFRGEEVLGAAKSDAEGVVHFDAREGRARAIVLARSTPAFVRDVSLAAGRQRLAVERGVAVAGRVRTVDQSPVNGVELRLVSDRPLVDDGDWPEAVVRELELRSQDKLRLSVRSDGEGLFEFTGLSAPWSGRVELGEEHELLGVTGGLWSAGAESIRLDDPVENLVLDVAAMPKAVGRIVLTAGGPGVPNATINANLVFVAPVGSDQEPSAAFNGTADGDGRFELPIRRADGFDVNDPVQRAHWPPLKLAHLTLDAGEDIPRRRLELSGENLPEGFDFGELVLERGATLAFVAVDGESKPLAGAIGRLDGERSEPTDETGRSTVSYSPGVGRPLIVTLEGYREGRSEVPKDPVEVLQVQLARATRLEVLVLGPGRAPVADAPVQVNQSSQGTQRPGGRRNQNSEQRTNDEGRAVFSNLPPNVQIRVAARDAMGATLAEQTVTLEPEEWRKLELEVPRALLSFSGIVRDEQGLALAEANVELSEQVQGRNNLSTRTDADGRFSFSGLTSPNGILRVRKMGFAPVTVSDFQVPPPGVIADIRLERGLRLTLRVVDDHGLPVRGDNLRMELAGERPFGGRRRGENEWDFSNLPRLSMTAIGMVGGREYRRDVEPLNGDQEFRVPAQGGLEVALRLDPSLLQANLRLQLRARDSGRVNFSQGLAHETLQTKVFAPLLPGDYQLSVLQYVQNAQRGEWTAVGAAQRVTVQAGGNQRIELER